MADARTEVPGFAVASRLRLLTPGVGRAAPSRAMPSVTSSARGAWACLDRRERLHEAQRLRVRDQRGGGRGGDLRPAPGTPASSVITGTSSALAIRTSRPEPTRFTPFSYFCTCWNVMPIASARSRLRHLSHQPVDADVVADDRVIGVGPALGHGSSCAGTAQCDSVGARGGNLRATNESAASVLKPNIH